MQTDRRLTIYTARSRKAPILQETPTSVQELFSRLANSQTIPLTHDAYTALPKGKQDDYKDVGGFIAGTLRGGRRRSGCVLTRCAVVLDADNLPAGGTDDFIQRVKSMGMGCCIYSTAKHSSATPRLRVVFVSAQDIPADTYMPVARLLCQQIQDSLTWFDPSTDQSGRIMYWPSHCSDVTPVYQAIEGPLLDTGAFLAKYLPSWKDTATWPRFPREQAPARLAAKQGDPTAKTGVVGAFCKVYNVPEAMAKYLPGVYEETATEGRYTFTEGSTWGGAILYDDGRFLFSHHATDPAGGRLVNAFDLVRLHRFSDLDDDAAPGTPTGRLPSYRSMVELAREDKAVSDILAREAFESAVEDFAEDGDKDAAMELGRCEGEKLSAYIVRLALRAFGITARTNTITGRAEIRGMPDSFSKENAANTLPVYLMDKLRCIGVKGATKTAITDYLANVLDENRYNPVVDMLDGTPWDGTSRFPELLRLLGLSADSLQATLVRKWLIQCVALAHNAPGKSEAAEGVLTLQGGQGIGKTMFFRRLSVNQEWFAEGLSLDLKSKDDIIKATSAWIAELGELDSTLKREQASLKAFITLTEDRVRAPYAREPSYIPRRTSFCATVNPETFLKDETGDRRFWVVPLDKIALRMLIELPDSWFIQVWAEAVSWWKQNPQEFRLTPEERTKLAASNRAFRELLPGEEELLSEFDYSLPPEQWGKFTPRDIMNRIYYGNRVSVQQVGRVLAKLAREDSRITVSKNSDSKVKTYTLPLRPEFSDLDDIE